MRHVGRRFVLAAAILLSAAATVGGAEWREIGSGLPRTIAAVTSLTIDPATPSTLYAVDTGGRLFKSIDSGGSWKLLGSVAGVSFIAVDPKNSSTIYAATYARVLKSTDGGENWADANSGLADTFVSMIAIDPVTPATLYAAAGSGIFKSTDAARSWNRIDTLPREAYSIADPPYFFQGRLTIDPVTPSTLYVTAGGIFKSTDGGQSWNTLHGFSPYELVVDPVTSSTLYAGGPESISKSTDGGQTWTVHSVGTPPGAYVRSPAIDPVSPSTLYAVYGSGSGWGILKSMDSGENWSALNTGLPPYADPEFPWLAAPLLAVSPTTPATVYTGYSDTQIQSGRLAKSTDGGGAWNAVDAGLTYNDVRAVAIDPMIPSNIYAGMGGAADSIPLFKSADSGVSWTSLAQFQLSGSAWYGRITSLLVGSASPNAIYAAAIAFNSYGAVFKTTDGGAKWIRLGLQHSFIATVMALDAAHPNTVYLGDLDADGCGEADLYKSVDGGSTWTLPYVWFIGPLNALVIDPRNPATLYAGTPEGVFKSADGGASWSNIGLSMGVSSLALDPGDPDTIYAAAGGIYFNAGFLGLFKSTDGGASWAPINNGLDSVLDSRSTVTALAIAPNNRSTLYAATSGRGVYKSLDGGAMWGPLNEGLTNLDVRLLAVASNALYAVTSSGIFTAIDEDSGLKSLPPRRTRARRDLVRR